MIKVENLQKRIPMAGTELEILKGITLEIKSGESAAIVGASGSGKSTLLGLLAGLDEPSGGRVVIGDTIEDDMAVADIKSVVTGMQLEVGDEIIKFDQQ